MMYIWGQSPSRFSLAHSRSLTFSNSLETLHFIPIRYVYEVFWWIFRFRPDARFTCQVYKFEIIIAGDLEEYYLSSSDLFSIIISRLFIAINVWILCSNNLMVIFVRTWCSIFIFLNIDEIAINSIIH